MANSASLIFCTTSALNYPKTTWSSMWKEGEEEDNLQRTLIYNHSYTKQSLETQICTKTLCQSALPLDLQPEYLKTSKTHNPPKHTCKLVLPLEGVEKPLLCTKMFHQTTLTLLPHTIRPSLTLLTHATSESAQKKWERGLKSPKQPLKREPPP
jgi:hypothetical protein